MVGEIAEAQNELRTGHIPTEVYFPDAGFHFNGIEHDKYHHTAKLAEEGLKPEGFPIELADVALRLLNLADDFGVDLQTAMEIKHAYNKTRPAMHGGKKF